MYENTFTALKRPPRLATVCFVVAQGKQFWVSLQLILLVWPYMRLQPGVYIHFWRNIYPCLQVFLFGLAQHEAATWEAAEDTKQPV